MCNIRIDVFMAVMSFHYHINKQQLDYCTAETDIRGFHSAAVMLLAISNN